MKILLIGASGFIGSAALGELVRQGLTVRAIGRRGAAMRENVEWISADLAKLTTAEAWRLLLDGCQAVVNCAGVFSDRLGDSTRLIHVDAPRALYAACRQAGVERIVLLSAIGADQPVTAFSRSKHEGETILRRSGLDWVILRPSIVLGDDAVGGGALLRGLAGLAVLPVEKGQGRIQPVQLVDVVSAILWAVEFNAQARLTLDLVGPERLTLADAADVYRTWLGWRPARRLNLPGWAMAPFYAAGEFVNRLGWRSPVSLTGRAEMKRGGEGDAALWRKLAGAHPKSLRRALSTRLPSHQERLFASFYFLAPLCFVVTSLFWIGAGIISLGPGFHIGIDYMERAGAGRWAGPSVIAGGLADILIGLSVAFRRTARLALWAAIAISLFYFVAGTLTLPQLWLDPIGPMLKIWPLIAFNLVCLAMLGRR